MRFFLFTTTTATTLLFSKVFISIRLMAALPFSRCYYTTHRVLKPFLFSNHLRKRDAHNRPFCHVHRCTKAQHRSFRSFANARHYSGTTKSGTTGVLNEENVLCILPFSEPKEYTDKLRASIPGLKLKWIDQKVHPLKAWQNDTPLPPGASVSVYTEC